MSHMASPTSKDNGELLFIFESMVDYQDIIQKTQQQDAEVTNNFSILLMNLYKYWEAQVNKDSQNPPGGGSNFGPRESEWATQIQLDQSRSQEATQQVKPQVDAESQTMESDGNSAQEVSQLITTVDNILSVTSNLLQSDY
ncbi:MAG: hypothetical protein H7A38_06340 [Chlamydiales bacterium]|nr:hypothetical protein [Chlamydiales bacterium]